jgi:acetyl-CoA C-acetyltransferase
MDSPREVVILSAVRTAIGKYGGSLRDLSPSQMGAIVVRESVKRAGILSDSIGHVVFGNVIHTDAKDMYLSRVAAVNGGIPSCAAALTVNRLCGSGLQAIVSAAQIICAGDAGAVVAGGAESMSRAQYWMTGLRWGTRMKDATVTDAMVAALTDPFDEVHMGITAENVARKWQISRADQDALAAESHRRACVAIEECRFNEQIVPIELKTKSGATQFVKDESPRPDATLENLQKLKPVFDSDGTVTAGNASSINDGASALVLMERQEAERLGLKPMARIVGYALAGVDPKFMGIGPVPAVKALFDRTGLSAKDMDVIELNEAFAAQALAVIRDLNLPVDKTNPNGSGIALGHPIGATGAILTVKALYELKRIQGRYGLVSMCIGGGQGIAAVFESLN